MTVSVNGNGRKSQDLDNCNPQKFIITATCPVLEAVAFDPAACKASFKVMRKGQPVSVFDFDVRTLALANDPTKAEGATWTDDTNNYVGYEIVLPVPYNLDGDDRAQIAIDNRANPTFSVQMTAIEGQGIEYYSPIIQIYDVELNRSSQNISIPDFCSKLAVVQQYAEDGDPLTITGLNFQSKIWNSKFDSVDIYGIMAAQYPIGAAAAAANGKSYVFYNGLPTFNCKLFMDVDTNQSLEAFVVAFCGQQTPEVKARAIARKARQEGINTNIYL